MKILIRLKGYTVIFCFWLPLAAFSQSTTPIKKINVLQHQFVKQIHKQQASRKARLDHYKKRGVIGENDSGLLSLKTKKKLDTKSLAELKNLVLLENKARQSLYKFIGKSEKYDSKKMKVLRKEMFASYLEWDPDGSYFLKDGKWQKKAGIK